MTEEKRMMIGKGRRTVKWDTPQTSLAPCRLDFLLIFAISLQLGYYYAHEAGAVLAAYDTGSVALNLYTASYVWKSCGPRSHGHPAAHDFQNEYRGLHGNRRLIYRLTKHIPQDIITMRYS